MQLRLRQLPMRGWPLCSCSSFRAVGTGLRNICAALGGIAKDATCVFHDPPDIKQAFCMPQGRLAPARWLSSVAAAPPCAARCSLEQRRERLKRGRIA